MARWLPELCQLEISKFYLTNELVAVIDGCRKLETLTVRDCFGFQPDEEILRLAAHVGRFEHEGLKLLDDYGYETDETELHSTGIFYWRSEDPFLSLNHSSKESSDNSIGSSAITTMFSDHSGRPSPLFSDDTIVSNTLTCSEFD